MNARVPNIETAKEAARRFSAPMLAKGYQPQALHEYRSASGEVLFYRMRAKHPATGEKFIRPMHRDGAGFELGEPEFPGGKPLFRLHELAAKPGAPCWWVEGENCADALARLAVLATTAGSSQSDERADFEPLRGRTVTIWPDNDKPGVEHAERVAAKLCAIGCSVEILDACALGLEEKGDAVDWARAHPGATARDLAALPRVRIPSSQPSAPQGGTRVELISGADVRPEPIRWLWQGWLAAGKLHIIAGAPEAGKTSIALALAATVTRGGRWPDGSHTQPGNVVVWSGEDAIRDTLIPRLTALGADVARVRFVGRVADSDAMRPFDPASDMRALEDELRDDDVALLIVDPIVSAVAGDSHENAKVRRALQPVVNLAEAVGCAVLGISHFSKGTAGRDPVERVTGSVAFGALPRLVFAAAKLPDGEGGGRIFVRAKSNIGLSGGGFGYTIDAAEIASDIATSRLVWGGAIDGAARELLAQAEPPGDQEERTEREEAAEWLRELLKDGPIAAAEVKRAADDCGYAWRTVQRAADRAGVKIEREGFGKGAKYVWTLMRATDEHARQPQKCGVHGTHGAHGVPDGLNANSSEVV